MKNLNPTDVPKLEGWMTLPDAAVHLGISRQYAHRLAASGTFESLARIGTVYIVSEADVLHLLKTKFDKNKTED